MNSFYPIEQTINKIKFDEINFSQSKKYFSKNNIINHLSHSEKNIKDPSLYKINFAKIDNSINSKKIKKELLHLSMMEFIKKNYKYNKDIINDNQKNNNNCFFKITDKFLVQKYKNDISKKIKF